MFCPNCRSQNDDGSNFCEICGIHRFYVGKIGTGILMILTFGGFGIWVLVDLIMIATMHLQI
jgi:TM2 domain-containing membrane protein YozV